MSGFTREDYLSLRRLLVVTKNDNSLKASLSNNLNVILSALEVAAEIAPDTVLPAPEADGDRTVHPAMYDTWIRAEGVSETLAALLRRVTELEKFVNEMSLDMLIMFPPKHTRDELEAARNAWLKTRGIEGWV